MLEERALSWQYAEIDPDIFGEELDTPAYRDVERLAAVGLVATARGDFVVRGSDRSPS